MLKGFSFEENSSVFEINKKRSDILYFFRRIWIEIYTGKLTKGLQRYSICLVLVLVSVSIGVTSSYMFFIFSEFIRAETNFKLSLASINGWHLSINTL